MHGIEQETVLRWLIFLAIFIVLNILFNRWNVRRGARKIQSNMKKGYSTLHEYAPADPSTFKRVDLQYYDRMRQFFEGKGFRHMADLENITVSRLYPSMRTFIRVMLSPGGGVTASIFHVNPKGFLRLLQCVGMLDRDMCIIDLETEFADGTFLCTSNAQSASKLTSPPAIHAEFVSRKRTPEEMLHMHLSKVEDTLARNPGLAARPAQTLDDLRAAQDRMQEIKNHFRRSQNWLSPKEMENISARGTKASGRAVMAVWDEIEKPPPINRPVQPPARDELRP